MHTNFNYEPIARAKRAISSHAQKRSQQRGISARVIELVRIFGEAEYDNHGGIRYLMTEKAMRVLRLAVGSTKQVEALAGVYLVLSTDNETVITVGHRYN